MAGKVPIFMTNLYHGGPYLGVAGAKVGLEYSFTSLGLDWKHHHPIAHHLTFNFFWLKKICEISVLYITHKDLWFSKLLTFSHVCCWFFIYLCFQSQIYGVISVITGMAAIWSITAISMERAWVIYCITRAKQHRVTMARMRIIMTGLWISALAISLPPLMGWNRYIYEVRNSVFLWGTMFDPNMLQVYFRQASSKIQEGLNLSQLPSPDEGLVLWSTIL